MQQIHYCLLACYNYYIGSAHTVLGPYWSTVLNKKVFKARQCSPRGGDITVEVHKDTGRVSLTGSACIVLKGKLNI